MTVFLLPDDGSGRVIGFDSTLAENHESIALVTEHPVEEGANIADHVRTTPKVFSCEVMVSNAPTNEAEGRGKEEIVELDVPVYEPPPQLSLGGATRAVASLFAGPKGPFKLSVLSFDTIFDRVSEYQEMLDALQDARKPMLVFTSRKAYENMVLEAISSPVTESIGMGIFQLQFRQIIIVTNDIVAAPKPKEPSGNPKQGKGAQEKKPVNSKKALSTKSLALKLLEGLGVGQ